jgi:high-affinity iron transporter
MIPRWMGMWFSVFPTYETLIAQFIAAVLVIGSYYAARHFGGRPAIAEPVQEAKSEARVAIAKELQPAR